MQKFHTFEQFEKSALNSVDTRCLCSQQINHFKNSLTNFSKSTNKISVSLFYFQTLFVPENQAEKKSSTQVEPSQQPVTKPPQPCNVKVDKFDICIAYDFV